MRSAVYRIIQSVSYEDGTSHSWPMPARYRNLADACNGMRLYCLDHGAGGWAVTDHAADWSQVTLANPKLPSQSVSLDVALDA